MFAFSIVKLNERISISRVHTSPPPPKECFHGNKEKINMKFVWALWSGLHVFLMSVCMDNKENICIWKSMTFVFGCDGLCRRNSWPPARLYRPTWGDIWSDWNWDSWHTIKKVRVFINADSGLKLKFISLSHCVDLNLTVLQPANTAEMWMWSSKF